jgi:hypothetical protein
MVFVATNIKAIIFLARGKETAAIVGRAFAGTTLASKTPTFCLGFVKTS